MFIVVSCDRRFESHKRCLHNVNILRRSNRRRTREGEDEEEGGVWGMCINARPAELDNGDGESVRCLAIAVYRARCRVVSPARRSAANCQLESIIHLEQSPIARRYRPDVSTRPVRINEPFMLTFRLPHCYRIRRIHRNTRCFNFISEYSLLLNIHSCPSQ